ncbi:MAG: hypothetical protein A2Y76_06475 [Planctomycetes bacterium RBG_13_60_9]|nr:MAG: hypothetical protein A2Y76_06475 [Planctomycetes bacterium RBG_13_60_9]
MAHMPANQKIYHITHVRNLPQIVQARVIWSDAKRMELSLDCEIVGMSRIKHRRLYEIEVRCHPGTNVGEYTPFYFCPRSIMLYILYKGNHPDVNHTEGQGPIVHLQADLTGTIQWAEQHGMRWAFSDRNAGTHVAQFYNSLDDLDKVNWRAVTATDFRDIMIKEGKQAEFLTYESFPWELIERIGVRDSATAKAVQDAVSESNHQPTACVEPSWYY